MFELEVTWMYSILKTEQSKQLDLCILLYVNHASIGNIAIYLFLKLYQQLMFFERFDLSKIHSIVIIRV